MASKKLTRLSKQDISSKLKNLQDTDIYKKKLIGTINALHKPTKYSSGLCASTN